MGAVCCCFRPEDFDDYLNPNTSLYRNRTCLSIFLQNFLFAYASLSRRGELHSVPSSNIQGAASMTSIASLDNSLADMYSSPPMPLPYDTDPRYLRLQHDGLVSRRDKGSSYSHEESEHLREGNEPDSEIMSIEEKWNDYASKEDNSRTSLKISSGKETAGVTHSYFSSDEEDVCPTCLEEYTSENPRIITKCSHHFHLGCIYEWMERSENCPICDEVMAFDETT